jgi:hypothetical protein
MVEDSRCSLAAICPAYWIAKDAHKIRSIPGNPGQNLTRSDPSPEIPDKTYRISPIPGNPGENVFGG